MHTHDVQVILVLRGTLGLLSGELSRSRHRGHPARAEAEGKGISGAHEQEDGPVSQCTQTVRC